ncbi:hypothetical protein MKW92_000147 [Papaver armeniacum]|nr:hypothetical protein MKW92_000147 [Papaver armeniacum]
MNPISTCVMNPPENPSSLSLVVSSVDILIQILSRLPIKILLEFKLVSKKWRSIISDPFFAWKHCHQYPHSVNGIILHTNQPKLEFVSLDGSSSSAAPFETLDFVKDPKGIRIDQSCNGLMCCSSIRASFSERTYYVCNPFTKQFRSIVSGSQGKEKGFVAFSSVSLAYDPRNSPHYKVVCIWFTKQPQDADANLDLQLEIYSSETATWKLSGDVFSAPRRSFLYKSGVFWKGSLHWIDPSVEGNSFYFNVDQELRMRMPDYRSVPNVEDKMMVKFFGECRGHLHLIVSPASLSSFEVLEMETDYTGWNVKYHVSPQELIISYPRPPDFDVLLVEEVESNSSKMVLLIQDKVFSYDMQDKSFKEIHRLAPGHSNQFGRSNFSFQYIQTLACV